MINILAPTDFSSNSKAGLRFAMHWASQQTADITFIHVFYPVSYPNRSEEEFKNKAAELAAVLEIKLRHFIRNLYKTSDIKPGKYNTVVVQGILSADIDILAYCRNHGDMDFICIATRGAGKMNKIFGTHTGNLITKSRIPVVAVPKNYRRTALNSLLYASDFKNYTEEIKKVIDFARPLKAKITILHVGREKMPEIPLPENYPVKLKIRTDYGFHSLDIILQEEKIKPKPSLIIMFTEQKRNLLQKLISPSKTEKLSFRTTIPLLSFIKS